MDRNPFSGDMLAILLFLLSASVVSSTFISDGVLDSHASGGGRALLQASKPCPISFEFMNYTIITSKCKGPDYDTKLCCSSFKEFACPHASYLNDGTNNCAATMFSYINLNGRYPPGLFSNVCREGKEGLDCTAYISNSTADESGSRTRRLSETAVLAAGSLVFFTLF